MAYSPEDSSEFSRPAESIDTDLVLDDEALGGFTARLNLDPQLVEAYKPETDSLYTYAGMSSDFSRVMAAEKHKVMEIFKDTYDAVYGDPLMPFLREREYSRVERRAMQSVAGSGMVQAAIARGAQKDALVTAYNERILASQEEGLFRSLVVSHIVAANQLHYHAGLGAPDESRVGDVPAAYHFFDYAYGEAAEMGDATVAQLAARLEVMGVLDMSKELLDARFEHFSAVAQIEASIMFVADILDMSMIAGSPRRAMLLARKYKGDLGTDDLARKVEMHSELAGVFIGMSVRTREPSVKRLLGALCRRAQRTAEDLSDLTEGFELAYNSFGYELPVALQDEVVNRPEYSRKERQTIPGRHGQEETIQFKPNMFDITEQTESLRDRALAFFQEWHLDGKSRRAVGLTKMQGELVRGFVDFAGRQQLPQLSKSDAQQITDTLYYMYKIASADDEPERRLAEAFHKQHELEEDRQLIASVAQDAGVSVQLPTIINIEGYAQMYRTDWAIFRQLLLKTWPHYDGLSVVDSLEGLLMDDSSQAAQVSDNDVLQRAIEQQKFIAQQLDRIVLPPGARKEDLERELVRVGSDNTTISAIQWGRLSDLAKICGQFSGTLFRSKERSLGGSPPYFVAVVTLDDSVFAIAESPVFGNATYIVKEDQAAGTWLEVLELAKKDAREVGAHKVVHRGGGQHIDRVYNKLLQLSA